MSIQKIDPAKMAALDKKFAELKKIADASAKETEKLTLALDARTKAMKAAD